MNKNLDTNPLLIGYDNSNCDVAVLTLGQVVDGKLISQKSYFGKIAEEKYKQMAEEGKPSVLFM